MITRTQYTRTLYDILNSARLIPYNKDTIERTWQDGSRGDYNKYLRDASTTLADGAPAVRCNSSPPCLPTGATDGEKRPLDANNYVFYRAVVVVAARHDRSIYLYRGALFY